MGTRIETLYRTSDWQVPAPAPAATRRIDWMDWASALGLHGWAAAALGGSAALVVAGLAEQLPAAQQLPVLAALAAGIALLMTVASGQDDFLARVVLRGAVAITAGVLAYAAMPAGWGQLGLSYSFMVGWLMMGWIADGGTPLRAGLVGAVATMAVLILGHS